jgi:DNA-binding CsgD family transcriptional regulator
VCFKQLAFAINPLKNDKMKTSFLLIILIVINTTALISEPITKLIEGVSIWWFIIAELGLLLGYYINRTVKDLRTQCQIDFKQYIQKDIKKKLLNRTIGTTACSALKPNLTRREKDVLFCISEELTTQEIAEKLYISPKTVETHRMNLMSKLGARNSVGIIKKAIKFELLQE